MKNIILKLLVAVPALCTAVVLHAGEVDSSAQLPPMTAAKLETKTAGLAYGTYLALRKQENEIFKDLTSPSFENLPHAVRETRRAEGLVALGNLAKQQSAQLKTYKEHLGNAIAAYGRVGPDEMAAAQGQLEGIRTGLLGAIERDTATAGALAAAARLGGLTPRQKKHFGDYIAQLKRKQGVEAELQASGRKLAENATSLEAMTSYLEEAKTEVDVAIVITDAKIAVNAGAKAIHAATELRYALCGGKECGPGMFDAGPDQTRLISGQKPGQSGAGYDDKAIDAYINEYAGD